MSQILTVPDDVIDRNPPEPPPLDEVEAARRYGRLLQVSAGATRALGDMEERFAGEPREARTLEVIGREYSAAKKALDVDPNDTGAQKQLSDLDRGLDLYPVKKVLGDIAFGKGFETATGLDRVIRFAGKRVKTVMELYELYEDLSEFAEYRKEADTIRGR